MKLYYSIVSPLLLEILLKLMSRSEFSMFRLIGGTALSLYRGHRMSIDIDLFTDAEYETVDFKAIDTYLRSNFFYTIQQMAAFHEQRYPYSFNLKALKEKLMNF